MALNLWQLRNGLPSREDGKYTGILERCCRFSSRPFLLFSHWAVSNSLQSHGLQHTRLPMSFTISQSFFKLMSLTWWCHPTWLFVTSWTVAHQAPCPWNSLGKNTPVGSQFLLWKIFPTQGLNLGLLHYKQTLYWLSQQGNPPFILSYSIFIIIIC